MKKLLIIQQDEAYFLFETLQVLEKNQSALKEFETTVLVNPESLKRVYNNSHPVIKGITTNLSAVLETTYDLSVNLSLSDVSWNIHGDVEAKNKIGPYVQNDQVVVPDLWSTYLMTLKTQAPFLTFHLQDVYKNILGFKGFSKSKRTLEGVQQFIFGMTSTNLFPATEQEELIHELALSYPHLPIKDLSEVDLISDLSHSLYIGPATLEALKFCEAGGKGLFLSSRFQGFNLLPYEEGHLFVSAEGKTLKASALLSIIEHEMGHGHEELKSEYALYRTDHENIFGSFLKSLNHSDDNYPFYQSHVVLWNYLLNLFDTNLEITKCNEAQLGLLKSNQEVLTKFLRLHDYAMVSIDTIYHEAKSNEANGTTIQGHIKNLQEIEEVTEKISASHSLLRPVLDFYRIRRGQNYGSTLLDQSQNSFLTYSEEHQALSALQELFSVTLKRNEVNI